ncbi:hypothetical protein [Nocardioides sp. B-3]|uniref:hypothetical protein n=1 Tax=Nocardioides sp. B-3 TaxID=2895565 RepID=UPI0021523466|nr:hypothetical protein [Nocardioides sp. B-3]UUZ58425.1 hypothetical protein LP418_19865 [Nocardioides sp. B-3]
MSNTTEVEPELAGRDTASLVSLMLAVLGGLAAIVGFVLFVGMAHTDQLFVWEVASPSTAALLGAGFLTGLIGPVLARRGRQPAPTGA